MRLKMTVTIMTKTEGIYGSPPHDVARQAWLCAGVGRLV